MKCKNCGIDLNNNVNFCSNCGQKIEKTVNSKNKIIIIILLLVFCSLLLIGISILIGTKFIKNDKSNTEIKDNVNLDNNVDIEYTFNLYDTNMPRKVKDEKDISKNIEIYDIFFNPNSTTGKTKDAYVYGKNNNDISVRVNIEVEYYDAEGYRIDSSSTSTIVSPSSEFVLSSYVKDDSIKYKTTKLFYSSKKVESYYNIINLNDLEISSTLLNDNDIETYIKNNSNIEIKSAHLGCIYYKEGEKVFASTGFASDINPNETGKAKFYSHKLYLKPYDSSQKIEFDDFKVFLYSAYDYDTENYQ